MALQTFYFDMKDGVPIRDRIGMRFALNAEAIDHSKRLAARFPAAAYQRVTRVVRSAKTPLVSNHCRNGEGSGALRRTPHSQQDAFSSKTLLLKDISQPVSRVL
jgi:hypothetical protein